MATKTLYLTSTATASPFPTTSRLLSETANASEVQLGPGEFDSGLPGVADAGQWNPSSPIADTTAAAELDSTGATPGTTRQGWLFNTDLTGQTLAAGAWTVQLRLRANQGTATETGSIFVRVSIVTGSAGAWTTVKQIFTTRVTGGAPTAGQGGWRDQNQAVIGPSTTAANFSVTIGDAATAQSHTFTSGQRILVELGFGNGNSATDRTWRLDYNTSNSFITTPDISASSPGNASGEVGTVTVTSPDGTGTGRGAASGGVGTVTATAPTGTATGRGAASGGLATVTLSAPTGSAAHGGTPGNASGGVGTVTASSPAGTAKGRGAASGAAGTITATAPTGSAKGRGAASGGLATVAVAAPTGTAKGRGAASGGVGTVTVTSPAGTAKGRGAASGALATVTATSPAGTAKGRGAASGGVGTIAVTSPTGSAAHGGGSSPGNASGAVGTVTATAPTGSAKGRASASGSVGTVTATAPTGTATGRAAASGGIGTIVCIAPTVAGSGPAPIPPRARAEGENPGLPSSGIAYRRRAA